MPEERAGGGVSWAVLVGIDRYLGEDISPLVGASADVEALWRVRHLAMSMAEDSKYARYWRMRSIIQ